MKKLLALVALALALPAAAIADDTTPAPSSDGAAQAACRAQRTAIGSTAFGQLYGTNANKANAFSKASNSADDNDAAAASDCKKQQDDPAFATAHGGKSFVQFYGTGKNGANAFGKCVSATSDKEDQADQTATIAAAKSCKTEQAADRDAFKKKYGTNANKANAFGKCVAAKSKTTQ